MRWNIVLLASLVGSPAVADVTVDIEPAGGSEVADMLGVPIEEVEQQLAAQLQEAFNVLKPKRYLTALTDAHAFSTKGLGVDYVSNIDLFMIGAGGSVALGLGDEGFRNEEFDQPIGGLAPNLALMAGLDLETFGLDHFALYANAFMYKPKFDQLQGDLRNFGAHVQFRMFMPEGDWLELLFQWGGFNVTTGVSYSYMAVELKQDLSTLMPLEGAQELDATMTSTGTFKLESTALAIPLEVSTNLRLLYVLSLFGGAGIDLQSGSANMDVNLQGELSAEDPTDPENPIDLGTANVRVTEKGKASPGKIRLFAGLQTNIWLIKAFVQANFMPDKAAGLAFGLRLAW